MSASPKQRDPDPTYTVDIPSAAIGALRREARARDCNVARLVHDLLTTVAADGLVSAILDTDK
jgi:hypothetical protein